MKDNILGNKPNLGDETILVGGFIKGNTPLVEAKVNSMINILKKFFVNVFTHRSADSYKKECGLEDCIDLGDGQVICRHGIAMWSISSSANIANIKRMAK